MKIVMIVLIMIIIAMALSCDMGIFDLQAACKIKLKNCETIYGFIVVGRGGYLTSYDTNGFYWKTEQGKRQALFNIESKSFEMETGKIIRVNGGSSPGNRFKPVSVFYLRDISSYKYSKFNNNREIVETEDSLNVLNRDIIYHNAYELLDYIPVYLILPESLYLGRPEPVNFEKVYLDTI